MFSLLRLENIANIPAREIPLDPKGATHIRQPSTWGKSMITHAMLALLCGDAVNRTLGCRDPAAVTGTTARGTVLEVRSGPAFYRGGAQLASKAAYMTAIGAWGGETVRYIVAPMALVPLVAGTAQPLRDLLSRILPAGDVPGRVREIMGDDWSADDPCDVRGAMSAQTEANAAKERAAGRLDGAREALARAKSVSVSVSVSPDDLADADRVIVIANAWRDYDRDAAAWTEFDRSIAAWKARAPGDEPAYSAEDHRLAREAVARLEGEQRAAELDSARAAAIERHDRETAAKEAADRARKPVTIPSPGVCPTCGRANPKATQERT